MIRQYTLLLLRQLGLPPGDPRAVASCRLFFDEGLWPDGGINLSATLRRSETCITGFVLGLLSWFEVDDARRERLVGYLLREQMPDGGWNCQRYRGAVHSSLHTTANVLEGLRDYASTGGNRSAETAAAERRAWEFLLRHALFRSHRTGSVIDPKMTRFTFPPRWRHDVLRGLDYLRAAAAPCDERLVPAVDLLVSRRLPDGRWTLPAPHAGAVWFEMERVGAPSRRNTLRELRVLRW